MPLKVAARGAFSVLAESPFTSDGQENSKRPQEIFLAHRESTGATREKVSIAQVPPVGVTVVMRKKFSQGFQLEWNYTWSKDEDDDSIERDPASEPNFEMFNSFDNDNNINPLITTGLFDLDGFLHQGVGDPLQVQLAVKLTF